MWRITGPGPSASAPSATRRPPPGRSAASCAPPPSPPMADTGQSPQPGPDEINLSAPAPGELCGSLEHRRASVPAQVIVTLGQMGTPGQYREALWLECWG